MKIKARRMSLTGSQRVLAIVICVFMAHICGEGLVAFISDLAKDAVERVSEEMRNAEEWRHLRWSRGHRR